METEPAARPPEAALIQTARKAAGLTAEAAAAEVRQSGGKISATYWRDIERGYGGRRGQRVKVRASDQILAQMARVLGIDSMRLEAEGQRPDAAVILAEMERHPDAEAQVIRFPAGADDPIRRTLDVQRILGVTIDPGDMAVRELLELPLSPEQAAEEIRKLLRFRAEYSAGGLGTPHRQRR